MPIAGASRKIEAVGVVGSGRAPSRLMADSDFVVARAQARVGTVLCEKWTLDSLLGVGGMAAVYAATHRNTKRVAIKMLHPELSVHPDVRERFLREGYAANRVEHSGVAAVHDDVVAADGAAFLVMDLVEGEALDTRAFRKGGVLPADEVLAIADQVLDVLAAAHARGIIHRDLKPENIFLSRGGVVKVLDFGIARVHELPSGGPTSTQSGVLLGTPTFMAPEQARATWDDVDGRTDLWALGATMFTLLSGLYVHRARTPNELIAMAITRRAEPVRNALPDLHPEVAALIDTTLAYEREERWQSAADMQQALRHAYASLLADTGARPPQLSLPEVLATDPPISAEATLASERDAPAAGALRPQVVQTVVTPRRRAGRVKIAVVAGVAAVLGIAAALAARSKDEPAESSSASTPALEAPSGAPVESPPPPPPGPGIAVSDLPVEPREEGPAAALRVPKAGPARPKESSGPGMAAPSSTARLPSIVPAPLDTKPPPPPSPPPASAAARPRSPPPAPVGSWDPFAGRL